MIWRAGDSQNYGYNSNSGTLSTYNATYCDFSIVDGSSTKEGTYYMVGKRDGGSSEGTYRARLKIDWNTANACAINSTNEAPCVVDFMITVTYPDGVASADTDKVKVYATNEGINIKGYKGDVKIVNIVGQLVKAVNVNGETQLNINPGFYIVITGKGVTEVVVK